MIQQDVITRGSEEMWAKGIRVLQGNRFAPTQSEHLKKLIAYMDLGRERTVADMGCGFGWVSLYMTRVIPKAKFWLVNTNEFQLERCLPLSEFKPLYEDMTVTSIPAKSVDLVMFNYSLCHVNCWTALAEAARIARTGGRLFVYDYDRIRGDNELSEVYLYARFNTDERFKQVCAATGWTDVETIYPGGDDSLFREAMANDALYDAIFEDLVPVIWKAKRA
jgi:ubiquinone/menaquinone biosynthesis C-methylase UbiE